jgi:hypothetical protein
MHHQAQSEDVERYPDTDNLFEATCDVDEPASKEQEDEEDHAKGVADISSSGHIQLVHQG